jgi:starch phosphorylase
MVGEYALLYAQGAEMGKKAEGLKDLLQAFHQALPAFHALGFSVEGPSHQTLNGEALRVRARLEGEVPEVLRPFLEVQLVAKRSTGEVEIVPLAPGEGGYEMAYWPSRPGSYAYGVRLALRHPVTGRVNWVRWA